LKEISFVFGGRWAKYIESRRDFEKFFLWLINIIFMGSNPSEWQPIPASTGGRSRTKSPQQNSQYLSPHNTKMGPTTGMGSQRSLLMH
jgi:hypothetical protein